MSSEKSLSANVSHAELKSRAMQIFLFDDNDLTLNRDGSLSDKQKKRFIYATRTATITLLLSGLLLSALLIWSWKKPLDEFPWIIPVLMITAFIIIAIYIYWLGSRVYRSGVVESVVGTVTFNKWPNEAFMQVDDESFRLTAKFREVFISGITYKIYYSPSDNTIISTEIIE